MAHYLRTLLLSLMLLTVVISGTNSYRVETSVCNKTLDCYNVFHDIGEIYGCPYLGCPANGRVIYREGTASFVCDDGYELLGRSTVTCSSERWLGEIPTCRRVCPDLPAPANGRAIIIGDIITYVCNPGFRNIGSTHRRCTDGAWTGTAPFCSDVQSIDLRGINPEILLSGPGITEISGPRKLLPHHRVTVSFRYRVKSARTRISLRAELLDTRDDDRVVGYAHVLLPTDSGDIETSCLLLEGFENLDKTENGIIGVVRLIVELEKREDLTMTDVRFTEDQPCEVRFTSGSCPFVRPQGNETSVQCEVKCRSDSDCAETSEKCCFNGCGFSCQVAEEEQGENAKVCYSTPCQNNGICESVYFGYVCRCPDHVTGPNCEHSNPPGRRRRNPNGVPVGDCDNTTETGDCGYRNTGCSVEPWELTIADDEDEDLDDELAELPYERPSEDCHYHVCAPCLLQSTINASFTPPTSSSGRRKRSFASHGKAFCLRGGKKQPNFGEYLIWGLSMVPETNLISFDYNMRIRGIHQLVLYVQCQQLPHHIHVGQFQTVYSISHFDKTIPKAGRTCVQLHSYIKNMYGYSTANCEKFHVYIQAFVKGRKVCLEDFRFHAAIDPVHCPSLDN